MVWSKASVQGSPVRLEPVSQQSICLSEEMALLVCGWLLPAFAIRSARSLPGIPTRAGIHCNTVILLALSMASSLLRFLNCSSFLSDLNSLDSESVRITTFSKPDAVVFSSLVASRRACTSALKFEQSLPAGLDMDLVVPSGYFM